ncbi:class I adenylate-forming enzyme family protein [Acidisphaera sp. S103]|uniref:class I adenylate-forming enzyme family protein n=1 Tax=Acidisphaera sp. S103 TaxID=1747223 RepID=UPI00131CFD9C|nr:fatty acid--CoA ligase family protein [Acidisphaera sp. S103]
MNITAPIRRLALLNPGTLAVIGADHAGVSYRDFDRMIDAMAAHLAGLGVVSGQTVGLAMAGPNEMAALVAAMALARLGVETADITLPAERMNFCITEGGRTAKPGVHSMPIERLWTGLPASGSMSGTEPSPMPIHSGGSAIFRIFASSGTTGVPKFSAVSHDLMTGRVMDNWRASSLPRSVHICAVGMGITWGLTQVLRTFWSGGTLVLTNPAQAVMAIRRHRVDSMAIAPVSLQKLVGALPDDAQPLPSLVSIEVSGSALPSRLRTLAEHKLCARLISHYGATEAGGIASGPFAALGGDPRAVGLVHPGVEVQVVDAEDQPMPPNAEGILRIRGANCIAGHLGDDGAPSDSVFRDGWFYSGDIGSVSGEGLLTVSGRAGDFINSGGIKVSPLVIEDVLLSLPQVTDAAVFAVPDSMGVMRIWAAIVAGTPVETAALKALCHARLAEKSPRFILQVKGLPRNANGKLMRDELVQFALTRQPD